MGERNIFLKIAYDGTGFHGWQRQSGARTVCGELEDAFFRACAKTVKIEGCSRTDAGVHALGQTATVRLEAGIPTERIARVLNGCLSPGGPDGAGEIRILEAKEMPEDFHARYSSRGKRYVYRIRNAAVPDIFERTRCYQIARPLDICAMCAAAELIKGTRDFACFQTSGKDARENTVRTVWRLDVEKSGDNISITVEGDGFLYNMVRNIAGTLVEAGQGKRTASSVSEALASRDRRMAGHTAPPQGLYLEEVFYDEQKTDVG